MSGDILEVGRHLVGVDINAHNVVRTTLRRTFGQPGGCRVRLLAGPRCSKTNLRTKTMRQLSINSLVTFRLPTKRAKGYALRIGAQLNKGCTQKHRLLDAAPQLRPFFRDDIVTPEAANFVVSASGKTEVTVRLEGGTCIRPMLLFINHLLQKFDPKGCVLVEWSHTNVATDMKSDGGGAARVLAAGIHWLDSASWLGMASQNPQDACVIRNSEVCWSSHSLTCPICGQDRCDCRGKPPMADKVTLGQGSPSSPGFGTPMSFN
jgi:hypothetical protein